MAMSPAKSESVDDTNASLDLLQIRLRRLEFLLSGTSSLDGLPDAATRPDDSNTNVLARLDAIQNGLNKLRRSGDVVGEMIGDVESIYSKYPELRKGVTSDSVQDSSMQASVVLANATLYPETASRLASLQNLQIPPAESSKKLTVLSDDIEKCLRDQNELDDEVQELRQRSARCLEWWVKTGVVGMGDLWEEWEYRMIELERQVSRFERRQKEQEGYI